MNSEVRQRQSWDGLEKYTLCMLGNFSCLQLVSECNCYLLFFLNFKTLVIVIIPGTCKCCFPTHWLAY